MSPSTDRGGFRGTHQRLLAPVLTLSLGAALFVVVAASPAFAAVRTCAGSGFVVPVDSEVVDGFRPPATFAGSGNRGFEYSVTDEQPVRAAAGGIVVFSGAIGSRQFVSVDHPGGLRTTYSDVYQRQVRRGEHVAAGQILAVADGSFHFGVRCGSCYLDPASVLGAACDLGSSAWCRRRVAPSLRPPVIDRVGRPEQRDFAETR